MIKYENPIYPSRDGILSFLQINRILNLAFEYFKILNIAETWIFVSISKFPQTVTNNLYIAELDKNLS